ncbi:DUF1398 family protein [Lactococcus kimchii]|uniref:DUF1398 family protein n=1 Tax=Lactococcus sp. S-13 TaxID=2507158 RepID=UPI001022E861|nr:DUF1398 family protein [Lactococcus sp. S-13]RZI49650.1 DUF1398 domain-containing protein [Lactococcus sp. S-13]
MNAVELVQKALQKAEGIRPKVGGFPYLAECLRQAGVLKNVWTLPAAQSAFWTVKGSIVMTNVPLVTGTYEVPAFDEEALIRTLRADQAGKMTFGQFLLAAWEAGVTHYEVDFTARTVTYFGADDAFYKEVYPAVDVD